MRVSGNRWVATQNPVVLVFGTVVYRHGNKILFPNLEEVRMFLKEAIQYVTPNAPVSADLK
jgi:hypothetical protein